MSKADATKPTVHGTGIEISTNSHRINQVKNSKSTEFGEYILGETICSGRFGVIREIVDQPFSSPVRLAMKVVDRDEFPGIFQNEAYVYKQLIPSETNAKPQDFDTFEEYFSLPKHIFYVDNKLCIVMEFFEGGDLFDYLISRGNLSESFARSITKHLVQGLKILHHKRIVHRDIKPENILFRLNQHGKLDITTPVFTDFGLSYCLGTEDFVSRPAGTFGYASPEILTTSGQSDFSISNLLWKDNHEKQTLGMDHLKLRTDVWSLGVLLYTMIAGELPFPATLDGQTTIEEHLSEAHAGPRFDGPVWLNVSNSCKDLITRMIHYSPELRMSIYQVEKHNWLHEDE